MKYELTLVLVEPLQLIVLVEAVDLIACGGNLFNAT